jgi:membrane-bound serine protease (ClpP class)
MGTLTIAYLLIAVGFVLLASELFLPTGGIMLALGGGAVAVGVVLSFKKDTSTGVVTLIAVFVALPLVGGVVLHFWRKSSFGKRFFLTMPDEDATLASMPTNLELEQLRGRTGRAISALRPSGLVNFDGRQVDCLTEGMMVEAGEWVRCIDVKAGKVIVRQVAKPNLGDLETADFG